jgi:uncharacterized OB-fold protein
VPLVDPVLRQPALVEAPAGSRELPKLRARQCACGRIFFPPHDYGCEQCGRDGTATHAITLEARGVVAALATVHQHPKLPVPFALGRVTLDAGISVDVRLAHTHGDPYLGARVHGVLVRDASSESGAVLLDLHFEIEDGQG